MVNKIRNSAKSLDGKKITLLFSLAFLMLFQSFLVPTTLVETSEGLVQQTEQEQSQSEQSGESTQHFWFAQSAQQINGSAQVFWNLSFAFNDCTITRSLKLVDQAKLVFEGQPSYFKVLFNFIISPNAP